MQRQAWVTPETLVLTPKILQWFFISRKFNDPCASRDPMWSGSTCPPCQLYLHHLLSGVNTTLNLIYPHYSYCYSIEVRHIPTTGYVRLLSPLSGSPLCTWFTTLIPPGLYSTKLPSLSKAFPGHLSYNFSSHYWILQISVYCFDQFYHVVVSCSLEQKLHKLTFSTVLFPAVSLVLGIW